MWEFHTEILLWMGIVFCLSQSAVFSGLNLAFFSLSRLRLEVEVSHSNDSAKTILALRNDSNFLLATILWGNVGINVLLTLLSDSVLVGVMAFVFSTVFITLFGEIIPQAYFSRNAMKMGARLAPLITFYQWLLFPVAKPSAMLLDTWLGREGVNYFRENDLKTVIEKHIEAEGAEVERLEGIGAVNFLTIDDIKVLQEGEQLAPESVIPLESKVDFPLIPDIDRVPSDPFLQRVNASGLKWVVLTNQDKEPLMVVDSDGLLRAALFNPDSSFDPYDYCHRPVIVTDTSTNLGEVIRLLKTNESLDIDHDGDIELDLVLVWGEHPRIITGADILGRLLKGTVPNDSASTAAFDHGI